MVLNFMLIEKSLQPWLQEVKNIGHINISCVWKWQRSLEGFQKKIIYITSYTFSNVVVQGMLEKQKFHKEVLCLNSASHIIWRIQCCHGCLVTCWSSLMKTMWLHPSSPRPIRSLYWNINGSFLKSTHLFRKYPHKIWNKSNSMWFLYNWLYTLCLPIPEIQLNWKKKKHACYSLDFQCLSGFM